jgi:hypothetical protein
MKSHLNATHAKCLALIWTGLVADGATVLHLRFDGDTGVSDGATAMSILDSSGSGNHATSVNGPTYAADSPSVTVPLTGAGNSYSLDLERSSNQRLSVADHGSIDFGAGSAFTIEGYVRLETLGSFADATTRQYLVHKKSGNNADSQLNYGFLVSTGNISGGDGSGRQLALQLGNGSGFSTIYSDLRIDDNEWHYVAVRFDDGTNAVRFTLDGTHDDKTSTQAIAANALNLLIGAHITGSGIYDAHFDGRIDELRISDAFLADSELLNAVPEPSSLLLAGLGLGAVMKRRRDV